MICVYYLWKTYENVSYTTLSLRKFLPKTKQKTCFLITTIISTTITIIITIALVQLQLFYII